MNILLEKITNLQKPVYFSGGTKLKQEKENIGSHSTVKEANQIPKSYLSGNEVVKLHKKQNISFTGCDDVFPRHIFPATASNEDAFDRKVAEEIKDPDKKSSLEVLIKERTGLTQEKLNGLSEPSTINGGILEEIVEKGQSVLHKAAIDEYNETITKLRTESQIDQDQTMARVDNKLNEEIARSFQITNSEHNTITERASLSSQERESISDQAKILAQKITDISETERLNLAESASGEKIVTKSRSSGINAINLITWNKNESSKEQQSRSKQVGFEERINNRIARTLENSLMQHAEQLKGAQQEKSSSNTVITSITQKGINHSVAAEDIAQLKTRELARISEEKTSLAKFKKELHSANLIFMLKMLMKKGRVQPDESLLILKEQYFSFLTVRGDGYASDGKNVHAVDNYQRALGERKKFLVESLGQNPEIAKDDFVTANLHEKLGKTKLALGKHEEAEKHFLEAARIHEETALKNDPALVSQAYYNLGNFYVEANNTPEAGKWIDKSIALVHKTKTATPDTLKGLIDLHRLSENPLGVINLISSAGHVLKDEEIIHYTKPLLQNENHQIRFLAIEKFTNMQNPKVLEHIAPLLEHEDEATKQATIGAYSKVGQAENAKDLLPLITTEQVNTTTEQAKSAYVDLISPQLEHSDPKKRHEAIEALNALGEQTANIIKPTKQNPITDDLINQIELLGKSPYKLIENKNSEFKRTTAAIDMTRIVNSFGVESLSNGVGNLFNLLEFKANYKVFPYKMAEKVHLYFNEAAEDGCHKVVGTLYKVWTNHHKQAGENELASSLEQKAISILEKSAKLIKK